MKTLPGIREALEARHLDEAQAQAARVAAVLTRHADQVRRAADALTAALRGAALGLTLPAPPDSVGGL